MNSKTKATLAGLLLSMSVAAQQIAVPYEKFTLSNGLTVILHQDNTIPRATVNIWYHVGSGSEKPLRTGFAHLFEHILFEGSQHVPEGNFDQWLEAAGATNNGSTIEDRTNYYEEIPSNALDLALFLESDRMGFLAPSLNAGTVDGQRDVVKNERRQSYENQPYAKAYLELPSLLYSKDHPYSWPVIGSMEDLTAASYQDVVDFFNTYYTPGNASLCIAGGIDLTETRKAVEKWFSDVPSGKPVAKIDVPQAKIEKEKRAIIEDNVQLPRLMMVWLSPPAYHPGTAELDLVSSLLTDGKNSRLYKKLVYELQIAQSVDSYQDPKKLASEFAIIATARPGVTLSQLEKVIQEELDKLKLEAPAERELQRIVNQYESNFIRQLESSSNKADLLNRYYYYTGNPDYFNEDFQRYKALDGNDIKEAIRQYLKDDARVVLSIVPEGKTELAAKK